MIRNRWWKSLALISGQVCFWLLDHYVVLRRLGFSSSVLGAGVILLSFSRCFCLVCWWLLKWWFFVSDDGEWSIFSKLESAILICFILQLLRSVLLNIFLFIFANSSKPCLYFWSWLDNSTSTRVVFITCSSIIIECCQVRIGLVLGFPIFWWERLCSLRIIGWTSQRG